MKMKTVCTQTGLTERAVRFYVQAGLVSPASQRRGGRIWLDFSEADVARLNAIATLRRAGFTIEEIRGMGENFSQNAPGAAFALRRRLLAAIEVYDKLRFTDTVQADNLEGYAALLEQQVQSKPLPPSDQKPWPSVNWPPIVEGISMAVCSILMLKAYARLVDWLTLTSDLFSLLFNSVTVLLVFPVFFLPAALVLGSRVGKWLYRHFEYIP